MGGSWSSEEQEGRVLCGRSWPTRETVSPFISLRPIGRAKDHPVLDHSISLPVSPWLLSNPAAMTVSPRCRPSAHPHLTPHSSHHLVHGPTVRFSKIINQPPVTSVGSEPLMQVVDAHMSPPFFHSLWSIIYPATARPRLSHSHCFSVFILDYRAIGTLPTL